jgi:transcriptional regulator with XRE-family HTH domain
MSEQPFRDAVEELLLARGWSQRELAATVGVDPAHVSRLLKRGSRLRATPELMTRVARAFGVQPEYFAEYREWCVLEAIRRNPSLRERLFARVVAPAATAASRRTSSSPRPPW